MQSFVLCAGGRCRRCLTICHRLVQVCVTMRKIVRMRMRDDTMHGAYACAYRKHHDASRCQASRLPHLRDFFLPLERCADALCLSLFCKAILSRLWILHLHASTLTGIVKICDRQCMCAYDFVRVKQDACHHEHGFHPPIPCKHIVRRSSRVCARLYVCGQQPLLCLAMFLTRNSRVSCWTSQIFTVPLVLGGLRDSY